MKLNIMTKTMGAALLLAVLVSCRENEFGHILAPCSAMRTSRG